MNIYSHGEKIFKIGLFLVSFVIVCSFGVNASSAASSSNIYVSTHGNDSWNGLNSTWTSGLNGPKATIKNATGTVNTYGIIHIAKGSYKENNITINTSMSIIGENKYNTVINGTNSGLIFNIEKGVKLNIQNLLFTNGSNTNGGVINNKGTLTINNCDFIGNNAIYDGGAIKNNGILIVNNSNFIHNHVTSETSVSTGQGGDPAGGAIWNDNNFTLSNCNFIGNTAKNGYGGVIYNIRNMDVTDCKFEFNTAKYGYGGVIYNAGGTSTSPVRITSSSFTNNTSGDYIGGGAIYNFYGGYLDIIKSSFTNNKVDNGLGGAIYNQASLAVSKCTFTNNEANDQGYGGAISNRDYLRLKVTGSTFTNNYASYGGAIWCVRNLSTVPVTISGNTFTANTAFYYGYGSGGAIYSDGNLNINFNRIIGNIADQGSSLYNNGGKVDASLNWWGSNSDPSKYLSKNIICNSWLVLKITAKPVTVGYNSTSKITANLLNDNNGKIVSGYFPNGTLISFTTSLGTINSTSKTIKGIAYSTLISGFQYGVATVSANLDDQYSTILVTIKKDVIPPKVTVNPLGGLYNTSIVVKLKINEPGKIYYTLNNKTPTLASKEYSGPITIKSTTRLKYLAVDLEGNKSPIYKVKYTIDKTAPKIVFTTPKNNRKGVSLTSAINIKFSEKIKKGTKFSKIYIKNMSTGKIAKSTTAKISGNTIIIKMTRSRLSLDNYQVYIPTSAVKDMAGNKNNKKYVLKFKTSKY